MTHEEVRLWIQLQRLNRDGYHFRRQVPVDGYILDFAEFRHRLVIEVDGWRHGEDKGRRRDERRDAYFTKAGFRISRFWNFEINQHPDGVMDAILDALRNPAAARRVPRHPPR
jgi:very-short-patch-repair endonuclease